MRVMVEYINWGEDIPRVTAQDIDCKTKEEFEEILRQQFHPMFGRYLLGYKILN